MLLRSNDFRLMAISTDQIGLGVLGAGEEQTWRLAIRIETIDQPTAEQDCYTREPLTDSIS